MPLEVANAISPLRLSWLDFAFSVGTHLHFGIGIAIIARLCSGFAEDGEDLCRGRKGKAL
jgi:hypothetical protein